MSLPSLVNQRLFFCQSLVAKSDQQFTALEQAAFCENLLHHLVMSYRAYLLELAAQFQLSTPSAVDSVMQLCEQWQAAATIQDKPPLPVELAYLSELESAENWLGKLLVHYRQLPLMPPNKQSGAGKAGDIPLLSQDDGSLQLEDYLQAVELLKALIEQQRSMLDEW